MKLILVLILSLIRVPLAIYLYLFLVRGEVGKALIVAVIAGLSDKFDGTLARRLGIGGSLLGRALDPAADRIFIISALYALMITVLKHVDLMKFVILIIIIQEFLLIPIAIFLFIKKKILISSYLGKVATFFQYLFIIVAVIYSMTYINDMLIKSMGILMLVLNICSGLHHLFCWFGFLREWCGRGDHLT